MNAKVFGCFFHEGISNFKLPLEIGMFIFEYGYFHFHLIFFLGIYWQRIGAIYACFVGWFELLQGSKVCVSMKDKPFFIKKLPLVQLCILHIIHVFKNVSWIYCNL